MVDMQGVIAMVLAGGRGERLMPLTAERAKPSVPIAGKYRIIDFIMNSLVNSGLNEIRVLIQFKSQPLYRHITALYPSAPIHNRFIEPVPAQMRVGQGWYSGTADAVYQNSYMLEDFGFEVAAIFSGDHIFVVDVSQMYEYHCHKEADFTIAAIPTPVEQAAGQLGVIVVDEQDRIIGFDEKPAVPKEIPGKPGWCYASMGNYLANIPILTELLKEDAQNEESSHDFGRDVIPMMLDRGLAVYAYDFHTNKIAGQEEPYWRDLGTIASYHAANMDVCSVDPVFNLYNRMWPLRSPADNSPPHKGGLGSRLDNYLISGGCIVNKSEIYSSVLSPFVRVEASQVMESVIFSNVNIGPGSRLKRCIVDKNVRIPPGTMIGFSAEEDSARGLAVVDGITVVPKSFQF
ncbi:glucose-1-phosphate adenylyltransferase [Candidatus Falkowbacteria bacterium]|nr:glucose-1-phosphate adenylyltransferase [Candidatus Falkowbacteria bacterium]